MSAVQSFVGFLGRACLSIIFIASSVGKLLNWSETEQLLTNTLSDMVGKLQTGWQYQLIETLLPWIPLLLVIAFIFEFLGGVLVFFGLKTRFGALLLILFLIPTTLTFHSFWLLEGDDRTLQTIMFLKNLSIFGGLLGVLAFGTGHKQKAKSAEPRRPAQKP